MKTLLSASAEYAYPLGEAPLETSRIHAPFFLVLPPGNPKKAHADVISMWQDAKERAGGDYDDPVAKIRRVERPEMWHSFWEPSVEKPAFRVICHHPRYVPAVSDRIFSKLRLPTAEHDIPYVQRLLSDLAVKQNMWVYDTGGDKRTLRVMAYDIETTQYSKENPRPPVDMVGYAKFDLTYTAAKDLDEENFDFDIKDVGTSWDDADVIQITGSTPDEEIELLKELVKQVNESDVIAGHNILTFDNMRVMDRIGHFLDRNPIDRNLSPGDLRLFVDFRKKKTFSNRVFNFGEMQDTVQFHPTSFDTYFAARRFYKFLPNFSLKAIAPFLQVNIPERVYLTPSQMHLDDNTLRYNKHDVLEQLGITQILLQQALPLSFITGMPFEELLPAGSTKMWDHMALIRASAMKRIFPATCKVKSVCETLQKSFPGATTRQEIFNEAASNKGDTRKEPGMRETLRVVKYGHEMPDWVEYPDAMLNYHFPGGMTIKPTEVDSEFIMWWKVLIADVGAMYPTILKAENVGADTVRLARKDEKPDDFIWMVKIPTSFLDRVIWKKVPPDHPFAHRRTEKGEDAGVLIGIKMMKEPGCVSRAMTSILKMIFRIKKELADAKAGNVPEAEVQRMDQMYKSLKAARNAGTHGIMTAPTVSCRQFNLWGGTKITTRGQEILADTLELLNRNNVRVVYGDTDGIYCACGNTVRLLPSVTEALGNVPDDGSEVKWLSDPDWVVELIEGCNEKWRRILNYPDFELEPEYHDGMIFVKHKNYLIFDEKNGKIKMKTKGANFHASDKPDLAVKSLSDIMLRVLKENTSWTEEKESRASVMRSIKKHTKDIVKNINIENLTVKELRIIQSVAPASSYKLNPDGSFSVFAERAKAIEKIVGKITNTEKFTFVVTKQPLPGIKKPGKKGVKPIAYMYPIDHLRDQTNIDLPWYKDMVTMYVQGAFGFKDLHSHQPVKLTDFLGGGPPAEPEPSAEKKGHSIEEADDPLMKDIWDDPGEGGDTEDDFNRMLEEDGEVPEIPNGTDDVLTDEIDPCPEATVPYCHEPEAGNDAAAVEGGSALTAPEDGVPQIDRQEPFEQGDAGGLDQDGHDGGTENDIPQGESEETRKNDHDETGSDSGKAGEKVKETTDNTGGPEDPGGYGPAGPDDSGVSLDDDDNGDVSSEGHDGDDGYGNGASGGLDPLDPDEISMELELPVDEGLELSETLFVCPNCLRTFGLGEAHLRGFHCPRCNGHMESML